MADPSLGIKDFILLAAAPGGEQRVDLVVNPLPKAFFACLLVKRQALKAFLRLVGQRWPYCVAEALSLRKPVALALRPPAR
jgi:hypothetical protein